MSKSTKPVSLAPVKALSQTAKSATAAAEPAKPTADDAKATLPPAEAPIAAAAATETVKADPVKPASAKAKAPKQEAAKPAAKPAAAKSPRPAKAPATAAVAAKSQSGGEVTTAVVGAPERKGAAAKSDEPPAKPVAVKGAAVKSGAAKPTVVAAAVVAAEVQPAAAEPVAALGVFFKPLGLNPEEAMAGFDMATVSEPFLASWAEQMVKAARTLGSIQATLADHAVSEIKAGLSDIEACARSNAPSEVVVIQARAFRRSAEALAATVKTVAGTLTASRFGTAG